MISQFAKILIFTGTLLILIGIIFLFSSKTPYFGKLPGDIYIRRGNFSFYFPLATFLILSIVLSVIFKIISKIFKW